MNEEQYYGWDTSDEIKWLDKICSSISTDRTSKAITRIKFLKGYLKSMANRVKWDSIVKDAVQQHVEKLIAKEVVYNASKR